MNLSPISSLLSYPKKSSWRELAGVAMITAIATKIFIDWSKQRDWNPHSLFKKIVYHLPGAKDEFNKELAKLEKSLEKEMFRDIDLTVICKTLPESGWDADAILQRLQNIAGDIRNGKNTGAYYIDNAAIDDLILKVCKLACRTNPLHQDLSPLIRQLEGEIVRMTAAMFKGDDQVAGNVTAGGTDSIRFAVLTARERAIAKGQRTSWEMVVPDTAHPAFAKAANEYSIRLIRVKSHPQGHPEAFRANVQAIKRAITRNTIFVAASCPAFPHGMIDPIEDISNMLERVDPSGKIAFHVDACLGGFVIPWMEDAGFGKDITTRFGFDVPRVTSISCDTHKYGYSEKGTSVVLYRNHKDWRQYQIFVDTLWPGGIYATPTPPGSRSGRDIAATWAVMAYMGKKGYVKETEKIIKTTREIIEGLQTDDFLAQNLQIMGNPKAMVVAFCPRTPEFNIYDLKSAMSRRKWYLSGLQNPPGIHLCVTAVHGNDPQFVKTFMTDLKDSLQETLDLPEAKRGKSSDAVMYKSNAHIAKSIFIDPLARHYWDINSRILPARRIN